MRAERVAWTSKSRKIGVLRDRVIWAAENETLKNYGVNALGSSSSVAEVWRGVAGIDREGAKICCFFMFSIDCARGCLGRLGWLVCVDCPNPPHSPRSSSYLCAADAGLHEVHGRVFMVSLSAAWGEWLRVTLS